MATTLDDDTTKPSVTEPGDGPADTTDPDEIAVSAPADPSSPEAVAAGTVNTVRKAGRRKPKKPAAPEDRIERYPAVKPDGSTVTVERNIDTGDSKVLLDEDDED